MATQPLVSIVVPVYNVEKYLQECLDSLLGQTMRDIEVVCVDDGSTDSSPAMVDEAAARDARVRAVHQANAGVSAARNHGLELARGTYVLFVDSDDFIRHDACELLCAAARRDNADVVVFGGKTFPISFWADDCFAKRAVTYKGNAVDALLGEAGSNPLMCNKMYRRQLLVDNGLRFNPELTLGEDNAFQFCTFPCAKVVTFTPEVLYFYRNHKESAVMAQGDDCDARLLKHAKVVGYVLDTWREKGYFPGHEQAMVCWAVDFLYRDAKNSRLETRQALARTLGPLLQRCFTEAALADVPQQRTDQLRFILGSLDEPGDKPALSVVVCPRAGSAFDEDSLHSLEVQTEQSVELLLVSNPQAPGFEGVRRDARCRPFDSLAAALAGARAPWVVFAGPACEYGPTAFQQLLGAAANYARWAAENPQAQAAGAPAAADVVTFTDADATLEASDVWRYLAVDADTRLDGRQTFAGRDLGQGAVHFASIVPSNKLFATSLVRSCAEGADGADLDVAALAARCMLEARAILPTTLPLLTLRKPRFQPEGGVEAYVASCMESAAKADPGHAASVLCATAAYLCSLADTVRDPADAALLFCVTRKALAPRAGELDLTLLPARHADALRQLLEAESSEAYLVTHAYALAKRLGVENGRNLRQVGEVATQAELLRQEMDRYFKSVTYRAGRLVTALPRKIVNILRRKG